MEVNQLYGFVLALVLIGLVLGVGFIVLQKFSDSTDSGSYARNATGKMMSSLYDIPNTWLGLVVTIVVVAIVLGIVIRSFAGSGNRQ